MATFDWPTDRAFRPASLSFGTSTAKSGFEAFYTGDRQTLSHLSDRLLCKFTLGACGMVDAGRRAALLSQLDSTGDYVRFGPLYRPWRMGSLSGVVTAGASVLAGARSITLAGTFAVGTTLLADDFIAVGGNLLQVAYAGAKATVANTLTVPLVLPVQRPITSGAVVTVDSPTGTWQLSEDGISHDYSGGAVQQGATLQFRQVVLG